MTTNLRVTRQYAEVLGPGDGKARVTRQYVEVLGPGDGKARVTRQYVEVLGPVLVVHDAEAEHALTANHEALGVSSKLLVDTLGISQEAAVDGQYLRPALDSISTTQAAEVVVVATRSVVCDLNLIDVAQVSYTKYVIGISLLEFESVAVVTASKLVRHTLLLTQEASTDVVRSSSNTLTTGHEAVVVAVYARAASHLLLNEQQVAYNAEFGRLSEGTLTLGQDAVGDHCRVVTIAIELSDTAVVDLIRSAHSDLTVTHLTASSRIFKRRRTDNLALTHAGIEVAEWPRGCASSIVATHTASVTSSKSLVDTLVLTQAASADNVREAVSVLMVSQIASVTNTRASAHDDLLSLSDEAIVGFVKQVSAASTLWLAHLASSGIAVGVAESVLQELHYTSDPVTYEEIPYFIGLQDAAIASVSRYAPYAASHIISFSTQAIGIVVHADAIAASATSALSLTHAAYASQTPIVNQTLAITDLAVVVASKALSDTLALTDIASLNVFRATLAAASTLILGQSVAVEARPPGIEFQYHPLVGVGAAGNPTPPPVTLSGPMAGITVPFQLVYPAAGEVTDSVTLRAPEFGNKDRLGFNRISRETRGGTLVVFADPIWPKTQTLVLTFAGLTGSEAQALLTFLDTYLGLEVGLIDWEQRYWKGIIMTPENPVVEDSWNRFTASFEFEGQLDATWSPQIIPVLPNTPLRRHVTARGAVPNPMEPVVPIEADDTYYAESDDSVAIGQVVYIKATGHAGLARANAAATAKAIGFATAAATLGLTVMYITEGKLTLTDWTAVAGVTTLTPGAAYYLDVTAGRITTTPPAVLGQYVVHVGRATSNITLDIEIELGTRL